MFIDGNCADRDQLDALPSRSAFRAVDVPMGTVCALV